MATATADVLTSRPKQETRRRSDRGDRIYLALVTSIVWVVLAIFSGIFVVLVTGAWPAIKRFGLAFIVHSGWDPVHLVFGALPFIVGTVIVAVGAMIVAGGVGLLTAVCVTEVLPRWLQEPVTWLIEMLAFIPSVVYGLFGLLVLAPLLQRTVEMWLMVHLGPRFSFFNGAPYGVGYLSAIVILAVMLLPLIVTLSREALILVPREIKEAGYGLGLERWSVVWHISVPYARNGIIGAFVLSLGRALGETIAVAMTIGGGFQLPTTMMDQGYTLASVIANEFNEVSSNMYLSALIYCGLILFVITVVVNIVAYFMMRRLSGIHGFRA
jgi:phosphate transport system permease protein